jgi:hypothetical protein
VARVLEESRLEELPLGGATGGDFNVLARLESPLLFVGDRLTQREGEEDNCQDHVEHAVGRGPVLVGGKRGQGD